MFTKTFLFLESQMLHKNNKSGVIIQSFLLSWSSWFGTSIKEKFYQNVVIPMQNLNRRSMSTSVNLLITLLKNSPSKTLELIGYVEFPNAILDRSPPELILAEQILD